MAFSILTVLVEENRHRANEVLLLRAECVTVGGIETPAQSDAAKMRDRVQSKTPSQAAADQVRGRPRGTAAVVEIHQSFLPAKGDHEVLDVAGVALSILGQAGSVDRWRRDGGTIGTRMAGGDDGDHRLLTLVAVNRVV